MMATTHVLAGLALVVPVAAAAPQYTLPLVGGAVLGGLAPDLDVVLEHRRSLHFPVAGGLLAVPLVVAATVLHGVLLIGLAALAVTAWLHAASDALGGGPELDPWTHTGDRAVYDHVRGRWIRPRRWIRYDGAPEDAVLAVGLALPGILFFDGWLRGLVVGAVAVSIGYALVRRRLVEWTPGWLR